MDDDIYYKTDCDQEPFCQVVVDFLAAAEAQVFTGLVETFAREREFVTHRAFELPASHPMLPLPQYQRPEMYLHGFCIVHPSASYGQITLAVCRRDFARAAFERHVVSFTTRFHDAFPGRVRGGILHWPAPA